MANAIFTASERSAYDDRIEERYHFPHTYLGQAEQAVNDWIIYYEPRRDAGPSSTDGRQAYFAMALLDRIERDSRRSDHYFGFLTNYVEFDRTVPFRDGSRYYESSLQKSDGSTNKGQFGRSIRLLKTQEFHAIVEAGFTFPVDIWDRPSLADGAHETIQDVPEYVVRPTVDQVSSRKFRDLVFRRHVRQAYRNRCALTGLCLINGGGRPEVQAAHIRSVEADGPDTVRNGLALTGTAHWLFDRGLIAIGDDFRILTSPHGVPDDLDRLLVADRKLILPASFAQRPHSIYLRWHLENVFKS